MKSLKFAPNLVSLILNREKTITWRLFDDKDLQIGDNLELVNFENKEVFAKAIILNIENKKICDLSGDDLRKNSYIDMNHVLSVNRKLYGDTVDMNTEVKIIEFAVL